MMVTGDKKHQFRMQEDFGDLFDPIMISIADEFQNIELRDGYLRVTLAHEAVETYKPSYYETQLIRAVESILSPLGIGRTPDGDSLRRENWI